MVNFHLFNGIVKRKVIKLKPKWLSFTKQTGFTQMRNIFMLIVTKRSQFNNKKYKSFFILPHY